MKQVTAQMGAVTKGMDKVLASMDVNQISKVMDQFEASFDNMQVAGDYVEQAMNSATASTMPEEDVDKLMQAVADEHALNFSSGATAAGTGAVAQAQAATGDDDALEKRLAAHNSGKGARSTRGRDWRLLYAERFKNRGEAMSREWYLKRDRRFRKQVADQNFW